MVKETLEPLSSSDRTPGGYCWSGRIIKITFGAASQEFLDHRSNCAPCINALNKEQREMHREIGDARRDGRV